LILFAGISAARVSSVPVAQAVNTAPVDRTRFAEFSPGEFDNVSLTSEGHLELAPAMTNTADVTDPVVWAAVQDAQGNVFFGTGNQGKIFKLTPRANSRSSLRPMR